MKPGQTKPLLVCLNLQRRHADQTSLYFAPRAALVLPSIIACMGWARRHEVPVLHVHSMEATGEGRRPIAGCEPKVSERLIVKRERSFLSNAEFAEGGSLHQCTALVVGFTSDLDCLAAAAEAPRLGVEAIFVRDAISAAIMDGHSPQLVDAVVAQIIAGFAQLVHSGELLAQELAAPHKTLSLTWGGSDDEQWRSA